MSGSTLIRLVSASVSVANKAGGIVKSILNRGNLGIVDKGVNDFQTEADRMVQRCIVASLSKSFPKITIIAEEELEPSPSDDELICSTFDEEVLKHSCPSELANVKDEDIVVWVDPLDGTAEFTQGLLDQVTILIGIAVEGQAVSGVIHQPYYRHTIETDPAKIGRTMWGVVGLGAFGIEKKEPPENELIVATTRSHRSKIVDDALNAIKPTSTLSIGGAGNKVLLVIEGKVHAYVYPSKGCKKWDTCAPEAILHAVGGKFTDILGNNNKYHKDIPHPNTGGILAAHSPEANAKLVSLIPESVRQSLTSQ